MRESKSEQVLKGLRTALTRALPTGAALLRNAALPERVHAAGLAILRDGEPGAPEVLISPPLYVYEHRAAVDLLVEDGDQAARDATFDALKQTVAAALAADRTLGGLCDYALGEAPAPLEIAAEGAEAIKAATVTVVLSYATSDPLGM